MVTRYQNDNQELETLNLKEILLSTFETMGPSYGPLTLGPLYTYYIPYLDS